MEKHSIPAAVLGVRCLLEVRKREGRNAVEAGAGAARSAGTGARAAAASSGSEGARSGVGEVRWLRWQGTLQRGPPGIALGPRTKEGRQQQQEQQQGGQTQSKAQGHELRG